MKKISAFIALAIMVSWISAEAQKSTDRSVKSIEETVRGTQPSEGFFNYYWDGARGKVYLEIDRLDEEFLMVSYLSRGMGSNDVGLDRGRIGGRKAVHFNRSGNKVLLSQNNYMYRAESDDPLEVRAVEESFATSVIWGFEIMAESGSRVLIDITDFLLSDQNRVSRTLSSQAQGNYSLDDSRSAIFLERTRNFPENTEFDATLTFAGVPRGEYMRQVVPTPDLMTIGQHISFIQLPELGEYKPRVFHPGSGYNTLQYVDLATPLGEPLTKLYIARHRLEKVNPEAEVSEAVEPIIYYLDPGTPEPMRSALLEGASWWSEAFEAIGYKDAYQVKLLPEDADLLDVRYNVIQWIHRATRGWSYGSSILDPRTGEILKGHVSLGSQRVRQDYMIAEALLAPYGEGNIVPEEMKEMALARLRQLSAHEVGHTLGFEHNYIASADGLASVMDYPHPLVTLDEEGSVSLANAYDVGIAAWDKVYVAYGYQDFPEGTDEEAELERILNEASDAGLRFLADQDARPPGSAHPYTHLWDNGENAVTELERMIRLREKIMEQFSDANIREGVPMAELEDVLVPAYMFHRYQLEAAVKSIAGLNYNYAVKGGDQVLEMVSPEAQEQCLDVVLKTIDPEFLAIPEDILALIPPKPSGYSRDRENFKSRTGLTFDPLAATESAAGLTINLLLNPQRASRLVEYHARDVRQPGLETILERLVRETWKSSPDDPYQAEIQRVVNNLVLYQLIRLASDQSASGQARALAYYQLEELKGWLTDQQAGEKDVEWKAHRHYAARQISYFQDHPSEFVHESPLQAPPGQPIGEPGPDYLFR